MQAVQFHSSAQYFQCSSVNHSNCSMCRFVWMQLHCAVCCSVLQCAAGAAGDAGGAVCCRWCRLCECDCNLCWFISWPTQSLTLQRHPSGKRKKNYMQLVPYSKVSNLKRHGSSIHLWRIYPSSSTFPEILSSWYFHPENPNKSVLIMRDNLNEEKCQTRSKSLLTHLPRLAKTNRSEISDAWGIGKASIWKQKEGKTFQKKITFEFSCI